MIFPGSPTGDARPGLGAGFRSRLIASDAAHARAVATAATLFVATWLSRLPFAGRYLFNWDSLQFALGAERFDLAAHRPHPPGYVGYVMAGRLMQHAGLDLNTALVTLSSASEAVTVAGVYLFVRRLHGGFAGLAAAVLLMTSPLYWLYGETALTYAIEPGLSVLGFGLVLSAVRRRGSLALPALVIGLSGAIRPSSEFFMVGLLAAGGWLLVRDLDARAALRALLPVATALVVGTLVWALPLLVMSGGILPYLAASSALAARVSSGSAVWRAGLAGLSLNLGAVLLGAALSLGLALPLLAGGLLASQASRRWFGIRTGEPLLDARGSGLLVAAWAAPALLTYGLAHIGQLAYVLFLLPIAVVFSGPLLTRLGALTSPSTGFSPGVTRGAALVLCAATNILFFALPSHGLGTLPRERDAHVSRVLATVQRYPAGTLVITDPEAPSSYRTAMYYLRAYDVVAVGRDRHGRAGEMFSNDGGAPEYDLARFDRTGPLRLRPRPMALILDSQVLKSIGDPDLVDSVSVDASGERFFIARLDPADPPVASAEWLYLRGSDCPCRGGGSAPRLARPNQPL